jgi:hypothetical protein
VTIYEALCRKLGREPTSAEIETDIKRIIREATEDALRNVARKRKSKS